jgi:hypothetical protein
MVVVAGVGEEDAALRVDAKVVRAVVATSGEAVGDHLHLAGRDVRADDPAATARTVLGSLACHEPAVKVEGVAVRSSARRAENRDLAIGRPAEELVPLDV